MWQKRNKKRILKGSVTVFALLLMFILAVTTIGIISTAAIERKVSISTGNSTTAFQIAETGMEKTLQYFKSNFDKKLLDLGCTIKGTITVPMPDGSNCSAVNVGHVLNATKDNEIRFKTNDQSTNCGYAKCDAPIASVKIIKSIGTTKQETRSIEEDVFLGATKLLLHLNGLDENSGKFTDASFYWNNHKPITATSGVLVESEVNEKIKLGEGSANFNGTTGYLSVPDSTDWDFGIGDFTIDFWVQFKVLPDPKATIVSRFHNNTNKLIDIYLSNNGGYKWSFNGNGVIISTDAVTVNPGTWYHVAYVRKGNNLKIFQGGVSLRTQSFSENLDVFNNEELFIGVLNSPAPSGYFNGYLDELRVSKGVARWWDDSFDPYEPATEYWAD